MAYKCDLKIEQGATFALEIACQDDSGAVMPLTGCVAAAQVRYKISDPTPAATFTAFVDETGGIVTLSLSADDTSGLNRTYGVWDANIEWPGGSVQRLAEGNVEISLEVTR